MQGLEVGGSLLLEWKPSDIISAQLNLWLSWNSGLHVPPFPSFSPLHCSSAHPVISSQMKSKQIAAQRHDISDKLWSYRFVWINKSKQPKTWPFFKRFNAFVRHVLTVLIFIRELALPFKRGKLILLEETSEAWVWASGISSLLGSLTKSIIVFNLRCYQENFVVVNYSKLSSI